MKNFISLLFLAIFSCAVVFAQNSELAQTNEKHSAYLANDCEHIEQVSGTILVRVTFDADGKVTKVTPISALPYGLTDQAINAAKQIRFESVAENGVPVAKIKTAELNAPLGRAKSDEKSEAIIQKAIQRLGGARYSSVRTVTGRGNFTAMKENEAGLPSSFVDYIVYPNKERTEFKINGVRTIQTNVDQTGWIADSGARTVKDQTPAQIADFKTSMRTSLDNFLRGGWRSEKDAKLEYVGRREASLGKRNEALRITYADGLTVEFEFAAGDGTPAKSLYKRKGADGEETKEEDRFAQFVEVGGISAPYIIDHYRNGKQTSRINYATIEFNAVVPETLFAKPTDVKKLK